MYTQKSFVLKPADAEKKWYLVNAEGQTVGRIATEIANVLRGKINPQYTPHTDSGDFVVVVNADKVVFTGNKLDQKVYHKHSGYIGGMKKRTAREQMDRQPEKVLMSAVKGGRKQLTKLKVFAGTEHQHEAQNPQELKL
jgi:large subunit ribosomal protein L13